MLGAAAHNRVSSVVESGAPLPTWLLGYSGHKSTNINALFEEQMSRPSPSSGARTAPNVQTKAANDLVVAMAVFDDTDNQSSNLSGFGWTILAERTLSDTTTGRAYLIYKFLSASNLYYSMNVALSGCIVAGNIFRANNGYTLQTPSVILNHHQNGNTNTPTLNFTPNNVGHDFLVVAYGGHKESLAQRTQVNGLSGDWLGGSGDNAYRTINGGTGNKINSSIDWSIGYFDESTKTPPSGTITRSGSTTNDSDRATFAVQVWQQ